MSKHKPHNYWTKDRVLEEGQKYSTRSEWRKKSGVSYRIATKNSWDNELLHIKKGISPRVKWTKSKCKKISIMYKNCGSWSVGHSASYQFAYKKGWFGHCCKHMKKFSNARRSS